MFEDGLNLLILYFLCILNDRYNNIYQLCISSLFRIMAVDSIIFVLLSHSKQTCILHHGVKQVLCYNVYSPVKKWHRTLKQLENVNESLGLANHLALVITMTVIRGGDIGGDCDEWIR